MESKNVEHNSENSSIGVEDDNDLENGSEQDQSDTIIRDLENGNDFDRNSIVCRDLENGNELAVDPNNCMTRYNVDGDAQGQNNYTTCDLKCNNEHDSSNTVSNF